MDFADLIAQYQSKQQQQQQQQAQPQRLTYSQTDIQAEQISVAYVQRNQDGSFETLELKRLEIKAAWTVIEAETARNRNRIGSMRLVPLDAWGNSNTPKRKLFANGVPVKPNECLRQCLERVPIENPVLVVRWEPRNTRSQRELHVEDLTVAYVVHNADGSYRTVKMRKTTVKAAWTTIISETQSNNNLITDMRMAAANKWENKTTRRRDVFEEGIRVNPNQCLRKFLNRANIEDPILLVCWEQPPDTTTTTAIKVPEAAGGWQYYLFTDGTDASCAGEGGPIILVHSAAGICQLDENGIKTIGSSKFIEWITKKTAHDGWELISLTDRSASVRVKTT